MAMLTIAGVSYPVETANAGRDQPEVIGGSKRAFDGSLLVAERARKRTWHYTLPLSKADADALEAAVVAPGLVTCAGADLPATGTYKVDITGWTNFENLAAVEGFWIDVTVKITEP